MNELMLRFFAACLCLIAVMPFAQAEGKESTPAAPFDVVIKGGMLYDGSGDKPRLTDVAIRGDRIAGLGNFPAESARSVVDAKGMAVAPGFINMLSWSTESLIEDGRSQGEIREGVTTEIMGEGESMGPLNDRMKKRMVSEQRDIKYEIKWNTLAEYLRYLEQRGISCNVASFIGASTLLASRTNSRRRSSSSKCASSFVRKWKRARSGSAHRSFIRPRFMPKPKS